VAVVEIPRIRVDCRLVLFLFERVVDILDIQPTEDEARLNALPLEHVQISLDVLLQGQREAAEGRHERLFGARVVEDAVGEVVGGFDAYAGS
jgi:hypothetical protein